MKGRRRTFKKSDHWHEIERTLKPGDYGWLPKMKCWAMCAPNGDIGPIDPKIHRITEHADQTITVSPSIQFMVGQRWHGYLENGVWRKA